MAYFHETSPNLARSRSQAGFSLVEMMIVILVLMIIMGAVFKSINLTQQTSASEQVKLDNTQQAREFIDQITSDLRNAGYPDRRNMSLNIVDPLNQNAAPQNYFTSAYDPYNSPGLVFVGNGSLWFTGNVNGAAGSQAGTANAEIIRYDYVPAGGGTNCPCLRRTEFPRNGGDPVADANNIPANLAPQLEIQGVQNGTNAANAIFTVFDTAGNAIPLPIDFDNNSSQLAGINSINIALTVQSSSRDYTGARPVTTVVSSISLTNTCSGAMVNGQTPQFCK